METVFAHLDTRTRNGRRNQYFMIHTYETGGRIEELLNMTLNDIIRNGKNVQIRLHGKGDKTRYIPFPEEAIPHFAEGDITMNHPLYTLPDFNPHLLRRRRPYPAV